jgi:hypothetical protein
MKKQINLDEVSVLSSPEWESSFGQPFKWMDRNGIQRYNGGLDDPYEYKLVDGDWQVVRPNARIEWAQEWK